MAVIVSFEVCFQNVDEMSFSKLYLTFTSFVLISLAVREVFIRFEANPATASCNYRSSVSVEQ